MVYLTRREHFNAAHRLYVEHWDEARNQEVFGRCANPHWHGHNYDLLVTVKGEPDPDTGFLINAKRLSALIKQEIVEVFDHKNLNMDVPHFQDRQPSTENFVRVIWELLEPHLEGCRLHCIELRETESISCAYYGE